MMAVKKQNPGLGLLVLGACLLTSLPCLAEAPSTVRTPQWKEFLSVVTTHSVMPPALAAAQRECMIAEEYLSESSDEALRDACMTAASVAIGRRTTYATKADTEQRQTNMPPGTQASIGIEVGRRPEGAQPGPIIALDAFGGTPAEAAGILPGDAIHAIDGVDINALPMQSAIKGFQGAPGSVVTLKLKRGVLPITLKVPRQLIKVYFVKTRNFDAEQALYARTCFPLEDSSLALARSLAHQMNTAHRPWGRLVLDFRRCQGGDLEEALQAAALLLPEGVLLGHARSAGQEAAPVKVPSRAQWPQEFNTVVSDALKTQIQQLPLVILVGPRTADAAEMLTQALRAHRQAFVLGETTAGADTLSKWFALSWGGSVRLPVTTLLPIKPPGWRGKGLVPDELLKPDAPVDVADTQEDQVLVRALSVPLGMDKAP